MHYATSDDDLRARRAAGRVARQIEDAIAPYTTTGLEAAVVRLLGVHEALPAAGADEAGIPLAQQFTEQLHCWGVLGTGGGHWLAGAMVRLRANAHASAARVLTGDLHPSDLTVPAEVVPEVLKHAVRGAHRTLEAQRRARDDRLATLATGPGQRLVEAPLGDETALHDAARAAPDLVILVCPEATPPMEPALQHAHSVVSQASERVGRYIRLGVRGPANGSAYLGVLASLTGLDAMVITTFDDVEAHFARRICARSGVMVLGMGAGRTSDDLAAELAQVFVAEQQAALAGLPPTFWGWVPAQFAHRDALATCFPSAFIVHHHEPSTGQGPRFRQDSHWSYADVLQQAITYLEAWPPPLLDPANLIEKVRGYWNPFA